MRVLTLFAAIVSMQHFEAAKTKDELVQLIAEATSPLAYPARIGTTASALATLAKSKLVKNVLKYSQVL